MKQKHIFIVDDDEMMLQMLSDHLSNNPLYTISTFKTGEDSIQNLSRNPDIIILDYNLNLEIRDAANGLEILKEVKKINPGITVIMLSSQEQYGKALETIITGAMEYVVKDKEAFNRIDCILDGLS